MKIAKKRKELSNLHRKAMVLFFFEKLLTPPLPVEGRLWRGVERYRVVRVLCDEGEG